MLPGPPPTKTLPVHWFPENADCNSASVASFTPDRELIRLVMKMMGAAPTEVVVGAGIVVLVKGSLPLIAKARLFAVLVLAG